MKSFLDHPLVSTRYFFPRAEGPRTERRFSVGGGHELGCVHHDAGTPKTLLHFHGNGEVVADWEPVLPDFFADCGFSSILVEYRGYGSSTGTPALVAMLPDGEFLLRDLSLDPARTVAFGRSIGSLYAVELARRLPLAGLILESGIHDLAERLLLRLAPAELGASEETFRLEVDRHFDQGAKLAGYAGPTLLLHARDDELVGLSHAERNAAACQQPTLVAFDRGGHNAIYAANQAAYHQHLRDFLATV